MEDLLSQFQTYLKVEKQVRPETVRFYSEYYSAFFSMPGVDLFVFGDPDRFDKVWTTIMNKDVTNSTKKKYLIFMRIFTDFLIKEKIVTVNLAREKKNPKVQQRLPFALSREDIGTIYGALYRKWGKTPLFERNTLIFDTFIYTGLRRGELSKLKTSDIYLDRIVVKEGKGGKSRIIYIPEEFGKRLFKWIEKNNSEYLFYTEKKKLLSDRTYLGIFQVISQELGMKIYPHLLRHTFASHSIMSGIDIYTLQMQLGHSSVTTTSVYLYINDEERAKQSQKLSF